MDLNPSKFTVLQAADRGAVVGFDDGRLAFIGYQQLQLYALAGRMLTTVQVLYLDADAGAVTFDDEGVALCTYMLDGDTFQCGYTMRTQAWVVCHPALCRSS